MNASPAPARWADRTLQAVINDLEDRNEALAGEIRWLRGQLGLSIQATQVAKLRVAFRLTRNQAILVLALYEGHGRILTYAHLSDALEAYDHALQPSRETLRVYVSTTRAKLGPDVVINVAGVGYYIGGRGREVIGLGLEREL